MHLNAVGQVESDRVIELEIDPSPTGDGIAEIALSADGTAALGTTGLIWTLDRGGRVGWTHPMLCPGTRDHARVEALAATPDGGFIAVAACANDLSQVVRVDSKGQQRMTVSLESKEVRAIAVVDNDDNAVVAGRFCDTLRFGSGPKALSSRGDCDAFLVSFGATGGLRWSKRLGGRFDDAITGLATTPRGIAVAGFQERREHDDDAFVAEYDLDGHEQWHQTFAETIVGFREQVQRATSIASDSNGNLFVAGYFDWDMAVNGLSLRDPFGSDGARESETFVMELDSTGRARSVYVFPGDERPKLWIGQHADGEATLTIRSQPSSPLPMASGQTKTVAGLFRLCRASREVGQEELVVTPDPPKRVHDSRTYATWQTVRANAPRDDLAGTIRVLEDSRVTRRGAPRGGTDFNGDPTLLPARLEFVDDHGVVRSDITDLLPQTQISAEHLGDGRTTVFADETLQCNAGRYCGDQFHAYQAVDGKLSVLKAIDEHGKEEPFRFTSSLACGWKILGVDALSSAGSRDVLRINSFDQDTAYTRFYWDRSTWRSRSLNRHQWFSFDGSSDPFLKFPVPHP